MSDLHKVFNEFKNKKVLVIGDLMADKYIWGDNLRISEEAPTPVLQVKQEQYELGGAANIANNVKKLGANVILCGLVGYDDAAHYLKKQLKSAGIDSSGVFPSEYRPTTLKVRIMSLDYHQQLLRYDHEVTFPLENQEKASIQTFVESYMSELDAIIMSDHAKGMFNDQKFTQYLLKIASERNVITVVKTVCPHFPFFKDAFLIVTSVTNAISWLTQNKINVPNNHLEIGKLLLEKLKCNALITYSGYRDIHLFEKNHKPYHYSGFEKQTFNVSGVGDTITAIMSLGLTAVKDFKKAVELAGLAVNVVAEKVGIAPVSTEEILRAYDRLKSEGLISFAL